MEFLQVPLFDDDVYKLLVRFAINLIIVLAVVFGCYRRHQRDSKYVFTFIVLNVMVFFICFALKKLELELGLALGLFAIFGIIRYRTESIGVHEMTYLFVVVGIAVVNALSNKKTSYVELATTNAIIICVTYVLEWLSTRAASNDSVVVNKKGVSVGGDGTTKHSVVYDNLSLLNPDRHPELIQDIQSRTGLVVSRVEVGKIDLVKGTANLTLIYEAK